MTVSRTYGVMQSRIADELGGRADLMANSSGLSVSPIQLAILDAIRFHESDRFYFNEIRTASAFSTVLSQEFYTVSDWSEIPNLKHIDKLSVLVSSNRYYMQGRTPQYMEDASINPSNTGMPIDYCYYNQKLRFYPIPNGAYPVNFLGTKTFTELALSSDSNVWTDEAEALIRLTAEWFLYRDTIKDDVSAARAEKASDWAYSSLKGESFKRMASMTVKATAF